MGSGGGWVLGMGVLSASGGGSRGYAAEGGATGSGNRHKEASSDRVGAGMRGDGTAPRFYK